jgi:hypothetical protein
MLEPLAWRHFLTDPTGAFGPLWVISGHFLMSAFP